MRCQSSLILCTIFLFITRPCHARWDEHCADGGQCSNMIKSYESLIKGEGCHSFYITGKCSRICTYSLKSLINRHMWSKCAERCEWSKGTTDGARSWLNMCLARPAPDVLKGDGNGANDTANNTTATDLNHNAAGRIAVTVESSLIRKLTYIILLATLVIAIVAIAFSAKWRRVFLQFASQVQSRIRRIVRTRSSRSAIGKAPLDIGPNRAELRNLQRGARRHLKAMRSALD